MNKAWLIAGAVAGCVAGVTMGACGGGAGNTTTTTGTGGTTSSTTGPSGTGGTTATSTSGGMGGSTQASSSTSGGMGGSTTTTGGGGGDAGTCKAPGTLHPPTAGDAKSIYCPFSSTDGGKNDYCTPGTEHCCETPAGSPTASACAPTATACIAGSVDWQCEDPVADCPSGMVCCSNSGATIGLGGTMNGMACQNFAHHMTGTQCVAAGSCGGIQMCTNDTECPTGQTCTAFSKSGNQVGGCM